MNIADSRTRAIQLSQEFPHPLGLVPTMGYLHAGHLALVKQAREECATVAASIFVNPTQFGPQEDYKSYPRDIERDLNLLQQEGVSWVFTPHSDDIYPPGFDTWVNVQALTQPLEGIHRPGHFLGVTTIVAKLFNIVRPDRAYFGEKDAQQLRVISKMVKDLDMAIEIVPVPIVREPDGLAMSSRNVNLNFEERNASTCLYKSLQLAQSLYVSGERNAQEIRSRVQRFILTEPLALIEYVSIADNETLEELDYIDRSALISLAVRFGDTRLIDNLTLKS
jgi:pantoate--beta-alanine ligase